jgi:diguanylate cyclase (GGDEF)-like protein/PAS domain S-box-containing protein
MASNDLFQKINDKHDAKIARALTWRYVIALALVASLSTAAWFSLHLVISEQASTAAVVNVSGRQRMLSQRTALFSNLLITTPKAERPLVRGKLKEAIELMAKSHRGLTHGDKELGLPATMSSTVHAMYFEGSNPLDVQVTTYIKMAQDLLLADDDTLNANNYLLRYVNNTAQAPLVAALDQMVRQYQLEGEASVRSLEKAETTFWLLTLLLLLLEAALIFHPFIKHVRAVIGKLQLVTDELQSHRDHLEDMIRQRTAQLETRATELAESEEKFHLIGTAAQDAIVIIGTDEQVIYWNPAAEKIFGYSADEIVDKNLHDLLTPASRRNEAHNGFKVFQQSGEGNFIGKTFEINALQKSGEEFPVELSISAIKLQDNWHALGIIRDITGRKQAEEALRASEQRFRDVSDATGEYLWELDVNMVYTYVSSRSVDVKGYSPEELLGHTPMEFMPEEDIAPVGEIVNRAIANKEPFNLQHRDITKSGAVLWEEVNGVPFYNENGVVIGLRGAGLSITGRKQAEAEIKNLAFYDSLTQLPNRRLLLDRLKQALASSARSGLEGALLFIDLDNFKTLNDTHGHDTGDLLLQQVAKRLESSVREGDTVSRLGGDEFVVMLEDLSKHDLEAAAQAETVGDKILAALNQPYQLIEHEHRSTPSIGVTLFSGHGQSQDELLKQADIAMYQAKNAGRNTMRFFDPQMQKTITARAVLESDLRRAVAEQEQFRLYYQVQVDSSGHAIGAEALLRWQHPVRGMVSPAEFIPLAEESGLILPLGHWVMSTACQQLAAWAAQPETAHLTLAVNVSVKQFNLPTFVDEVLTLVDYFKIDPAKLKLEITESMLLGNVNDITIKMAALKIRGINFSMDDFGTGYSSLQYLKLLPLDQLKIDRSFVCDIVTDDTDRAIVRTIIAMAESLNLNVIAEGVETEEQRQLLLNKGCTKYQGYLFGKPVPIEQFVLLKHG